MLREMVYTLIKYFLNEETVSDCLVRKGKEVHVL